MLFCASTLQLDAQQYLSKDDALIALHGKSVTVSGIIAQQNKKDLNYYKAIATKKIIRQMMDAFRDGKSTEEVVTSYSTDLKINSVQTIRPLFPDSTGKYGTNWINEEIIVLLIEE